VTHPLKTYLKKVSLTEEVFAQTVGTTGSYISQIVCGYRYPSRDLAKAIASATDGLVSAAELLTWQPDGAQ
jgi:DNA-binding transcriptional regulator YdaS (Cro superfamily)